MKKNYEIEYLNYLKDKTSLGKIYRKYILYPKLVKYLNGNVLDYGCGIGDMLKYRKNTFGAEINKFTVDFCISQNLPVKTIEDDKTEYKQGFFDSVLLDNVLEHILEPEKTIFEIKRLLKKNGTLVIGVPGKKGFEYDSDHKVFYDKNNLTKLMKNYDFSVQKIFTMPLPFNFLSKVLRQYCIYGVFKKN